MNVKIVFCKKKMAEQPNSENADLLIIGTPIQAVDQLRIFLIFKR